MLAPVKPVPVRATTVPIAPTFGEGDPLTVALDMLRVWELTTDNIAAGIPELEIEIVPVTAPTGTTTLKEVEVTLDAVAVTPPENVIPLTPVHPLKAVPVTVIVLPGQTDPPVMPVIVGIATIQALLIVLLVALQGAFLEKSIQTLAPVGVNVADCCVVAASKPVPFEVPHTVIQSDALLGSYTM